MLPSFCPPSLHEEILPPVEARTIIKDHELKVQVLSLRFGPGMRTCVRTRRQTGQWFDPLEPQPSTNDLAVRVLVVAGRTVTTVLLSLVQPASAISAPKDDAEIVCRRKILQHVPCTKAT